jgi:predicted HTH domain antitoxin
MKHLTLDIPDTLNIDDAEASMLFAAMLYEQGRLSLGQAADLAHLPKRTFAERLGTYNVSLFNYPPDELVNDKANANKMIGSAS